MTDTTDIDLPKLTRVYLKIKQKRDELRNEYKSQDEDLVAQQELIKNTLLGYLKETGLESVKTDVGTVYRSVKSKYWTSDWDSLYKFVLEHKVPEFFTKSLNQTNVKQFLEDNPELVPMGLNIDSEYVVSVRKK